MQIHTLGGTFLHGDVPSFILETAVPASPHRHVFTRQQRVSAPAVRQMHAQEEHTPAPLCDLSIYLQF